MSNQVLDHQVLDNFDAAQLVPGFRPPAQCGEYDAMALEAATRKSVQWQSKVSGPLRPGSDTHKREMCRMFRETFNPYRPAVLDWPKLDPAALQRLTSLPIWDIAVQTEGRARLFMAAYASVVEDSDVRDAIALNAWEEHRHKEVLSRMVGAYGIKLVSEAPYAYPNDPEWAYLVTGYSECIDSFFAFGLFEVARRSGFFPPELVDTFEPVMQEECRHILLFANWVAWYRANLHWWQRIRFELKVAAVWVYLAWERIGIARSLDAGGNEQIVDHNFTVTGAQSISSEDIGVRELALLCLEENDRRFAGYDERLLRPQTMPALTRFALRFMRKRKQ
jgi:hypothetical protein